jgi:hypothetical protein
VSGGSFNYLCHRDASDVFTDDELRRMAAALSELGYSAKEPAERTMALLRKREEIQQEIDALRDVWQAVEWRESCDWGEDQMWVAIGRYLERTTP